MDTCARPGQLADGADGADGVDWGLGVEAGLEVEAALAVEAALTAETTVTDVMALSGTGWAGSTCVAGDGATVAAEVDASALGTDAAGSELTPRSASSPVQDEIGRAHV